MRKCLFCGGSDLTREHVWPQWIWKLYHAKPQKNRYTVKTTGTGKKQVIRKASTIDLKVRIACEACNNGWMSRLENEIAKPALASYIISGERSRTISDNEEVAFVAWAMKTAFVLDFTTVSQAEPHYTVEQRLHFSEALTPPDDTFIWIANYMPDTNRRTHSSITNFRFTPRDRQELTYRGQVSTFAAGKMAFQVLHTFIPADAPPFEWTKATNDCPEAATVQVWPSPSAGNIEWPPVEYFDDKALEDFGHRFGSAAEG